MALFRKYVAMEGFELSEIHTVPTSLSASCLRFKVSALSAQRYRHGLLPSGIIPLVVLARGVYRSNRKVNQCTISSPC